MTPPRALLLHAPNVHTGGGFVLLKALLAAWPGGRPLVVLLDTRARGQVVLPADARVTWVAPNPGSRLNAEIYLGKVSRPGDTVLCFHGLPPLLSNRAEVVVFLQNRLYLDNKLATKYKLTTWLRLLCERFVSRIFRYRVAKYIVQTPSMRRAVSQWYGAQALSCLPMIRELPFVNAMPNSFERNGVTPKWDFVYVADGEAHKNHRVLLAAWQLLAQDGLHPSLALTLSSRDLVLKRELEAQAIAAGLRIQDLGQMPHESVFSLYSTAKAMIFPSTSESFGLPLIEAAHAGLPILAPELDYVRDVCSPVQTFDPTSPVSIARAVKRFLAVPDPVRQLRSPQQVWQEFLGTVSE